MVKFAHYLSNYQIFQSNSRCQMQINCVPLVCIVRSFFTFFFFFQSILLLFLDYLVLYLDGFMFRCSLSSLRDPNSFRLWLVNWICKERGRFVFVILVPLFFINHYSQSIVHSVAFSVFCSSSTCVYYLPLSSLYRRVPYLMRKYENTYISLIWLMLIAS